MLFSIVAGQCGSLGTGSWGGSPHHEGIVGGVIVGRDHDALGLEVFVDGLDPVLPSETGFLHASERNHVAVGAVGIDPDRSDLQRFRDPQGPADAAGPDARDEAVSDIVTQQAGLVLVGETNWPPKSPSPMAGLPPRTQRAPSAWAMSM